MFDNMRHDKLFYLTDEDTETDEVPVPGDEALEDHEVFLSGMVEDDPAYADEDSLAGRDR